MIFYTGYIIGSGLAIQTHDKENEADGTSTT